jgi:prepilin-type processing-associated H-X9-DG protein
MTQARAHVLYCGPHGRRSHRLPTPRRVALTIVETMVTLSVLSFLAALLIPAVQMARESARRDHCLNNLREILHACASHESARREFPYTAVQFLGKDNRMHPPCSPHERLLPYLEQEPVFTQIDFNDLPLDVSAKPPASLHNGAFVGLAISVFLCPTDPRLPGGNNYRACMGFGPGIFATGETKACTDPGNGTGAFVNGRSVQAAEFLDGLSNTVMFSERVMGSRGAYRPYCDYLVSLRDICTASGAIATCSSLPFGAPSDTFGGSTWLFGGWRQTWYNHVLTPNSGIPDCNAGPVTAGGGSGAYTARSYHPGGVNSAMADGSVRFVAENIDGTVWRALSTRRGGEAINP